MKTPIEVCCHKARGKKEIIHRDGKIYARLAAIPHALSDGRRFQTLHHAAAKITAKMGKTETMNKLRVDKNT
jgi:hypothetical protein